MGATADAMKAKTTSNKTPDEANIPAKAKTEAKSTSTKTPDEATIPAKAKTEAKSTSTKTPDKAKAGSAVSHSECKKSDIQCLERENHNIVRRSTEDKKSIVKAKTPV